MKKITIAVFLAIVYAFSVTAFATENYVLSDCGITMPEIESFEHSHAEYNENSTRTSGLITSKSLTIAKSGTSLIISGSTNGTADVTKCGFKKIIIEYRSSSSSDWEEYSSYSNLYDNDNSYVMQKKVTVTSGYQYRVVGKHYAYKNLFQTETIEATTGYLQF